MERRLEMGGNVTDHGRKHLGRNEPCHCGSGRKYKQCCLTKDEEADRQARAEAASQTPAPTPPPEDSPRPVPRERAAQQAWRGGSKDVGSFHKVSTPRKVGSS